MTINPKRTTHVWLALTALSTALASEATADDGAKHDAGNATRLYAELTKIVPRGWQISNHVDITRSVSGEPRLTFSIYSASPLLFDREEIGAPARAADEPEEPPAMEKVEIRLVTMPYLTPDQHARAAYRNQQGRKQRLEFERKHLKDLEYAWKGPRPLPPWAYQVENVDEQQREFFGQYLFLWLRTEPVLLPTHHYQSLAFHLETNPAGRIRDKEKMHQFQDMLRNIQQIVVPYEQFEPVDAPAARDSGIRLDPRFKDKPHITNLQLYRLGGASDAFKEIAGRVVLLDVVLAFEGADHPLVDINVPEELLDELQADKNRIRAAQAHLIGRWPKLKEGEQARIEGMIVDAGYGAYTIYVYRCSQQAYRGPPPPGEPM